MKKKTKIGLSVTAGILAVLFVALMIYYFGASYPEFFNLTKTEFSIPGLDTSFSPQGLTFSEENQVFIVSGYMGNGDASRFYFVKKGEDKAYKYATLKVDGEEYKGHCGGVAVVGDYVYVAGDKKVCRFNLSDALNLENGEAIETTGEFNPNNGADFILTYNGKLIVGEFYRKQNYNTPSSHHIETADGTTNHALAFAFSIDEDKPSGIASEVPEYAISMTGLVQGMTFSKDNKIVLSTSYGLPNSKFLIYKDPLDQTPTSQVTIDGLSTLPMYVLDSSNLEKTLVAPCMSEELVTVEGRVYVLFESACSKYKFFTRTRLRNVYSLDI